MSKIEAVGTDLKKKEIETIKERLNAINCDLAGLSTRARTIYGDLKGESREQEETNDSKPSGGHIPEIEYKLTITETYIMDIKAHLSDIEGII
ncbi:hypothetical protein KAR91_44460 [Candidatus Pacearchaeota archaeon]|nr:hypothetical protein [Candidatus Pacearchaeota archaeon]